jgi:hypothetical protein
MEIGSAPLRALAVSIPIAGSENAADCYSVRVCLLSLGMMIVGDKPNATNSRGICLSIFSND